MNIESLPFNKKIELLSNSCSEDILEKLYHDKYDHISRLAVRHKDCSSSLLYKFYKEGDFCIKKIILKHKNCDNNILNLLLKESSIFICFLLKDKKLSHDILFILYNRYPELVRKHINCPDFLKILSI